MPKLRSAALSTPLAFVTCLFLTSCASGPEIPSIAELLSTNTGQDGEACLALSEVRRYSVTNDEYIFIDGSLGYYIVTVNPGCQDLTTSLGISFDGQSNRLCGARFHKINTRAHQCTIREIFKFDNRDAAISAYENAHVQLSKIESEFTE